MSVSRNLLILSIVALCAVLICPVSPAFAQALPAPQNLQVMPMGPLELQVTWTPGGCCPDDVAFFVYRNGQLVTPAGITDPLEYLDTGLAPDTPHTYTVQAENTLTGEESPMSERTGETTWPTWEIRVPFEAPTLEDAIRMAGPGTTIHLAPGIYEIMDPNMMLGVSGVTIKGQDPEGVILELYGMDLDLDQSPGTNNTLSGVTVSDGRVLMGEGDTVSNCVFIWGPNEPVVGGGFVTNSVFDFSPAPMHVPTGEFMMVANSIFLMDGVWPDQPTDVFLLNNNFAGGFDWMSFPGEGNYSAGPCFEPDPGPGPGPDPFWYPSFLPCYGDDTDAGAFVGLYVPDMMPDVGAFELYEPYTPRPPADLTAVWDETQAALVLTWTLSPDDPFHPDPPPPPPTMNPIMEYIVYRSSTPDMMYPMERPVPVGQNTFADPEAYPGGSAFYYQVRASMGPPMMDPWPVVSMPTNTLTTDAPANLRLRSVTDSTVDLEWDPPMYMGPSPPWFNVYRNGRLITPDPIPMTSYFDAGLAPETPHTYTVQAVPECVDPPECTVTPPGSYTSIMSEHLGAMTTTGNVLRVPQDFPTIQDAINFAAPGTSIRVMPGVYAENFINFFGHSQVSVVCQDAQGCILEDISGTGMIDLGLGAGTNNTLSGFTVIGLEVNMGEGDTVSRCVFRDSIYRAVTGGGFVTNSVFDGFYANPWFNPPVRVEPDQTLMVANSVFLGSNPFELMDVTSEIYLLNNAFDGFDWSTLPGEGNFWDSPPFRQPGPTATYVIDGGPCVDGGIDVGIPFFDAGPDVGAFELSVGYTPEPPSNLTATFNEVTGAIELNWTASPDDSFFNPGTLNPVWEYVVYRSDVPGGLVWADPLMSIPAGQTDFQDFGAVPGITHYYQVRANSGPPVPPGPGILSTPTSSASAVVNYAPTANDDTFTVDFEMPILVPAPGVLGNDTDPEFDPLTAVIKTLPLGDLVLFDDGSVYYTPDPGFVGDDTFTYVANDGFSDSNIATVTMTVVNDPPTATDDSYSVNKNDNLFVAPPGILQNDNDPEGGPLSAFLVSDVTNGILFLEPAGDIDYTPNPGFSGTDSFTYVANDGFGDSSIATVTITVVNQAPVAVDDGYSVNTDDTLSVVPPGVLLNDSDPDGDPLSSSLVSGTTNGFVNLRPLGDFDYTPNPGFSGTDSFTYVANDGFGDSNVATVTITVVNQAPVAVDDSYSVNSNETLFVPPPGVLVNDTDPENDPFTASLVSGAANGTVILLPLGDFDYTPNPGFSGTDSFTYVANDGTTDSNVATVTITVLNQAPVAVDDSYSVDENDTLIVAPPGVLLNDTDPEGDLLSASLVSDVANGTLSLRPLGDFDYTPNPGFSGTDSFTYVVNDGTSDSNVATITITVNQVNDNPPTANDESYVTNEDAQLVRAAPGVLSNDTDLDNDPLTAVLISDVSHGTLNLNSDGSFNYIPDPDYFGIDSFTYTAYDGLHTSNVATVTITLNPIKDAPRLDNPGPQYNSEGDSVTLDITFTDPDSSSFTYSASGLPPGLTLDTVTGRIQGTLTYESAGTYSITWSVSDGYYLASAVFPWEVTNTNRAPVADDQAVATDEDTAVAITLTASDLDGDSLTYAVVTGPTNGTLSGTEPDLTYTPNADYNGSDSFTFSASDGNGGSDNGSVSITVSGANDAPTADDQNVATPEDTPLDITLTASDIDGDTLSYDVAAGPSNGSLSGTAPNLTYTPNPDYNGPDSFTFTANDGTVDSNTATVSISVSAANDAPAVTNPGTQNSTEGDTVSLPISASDVDGDTLSYSAAGLPAGLSIDSETGLISGSLTFDSADSYGVTVTVSDGTAATDVVFSWNVSDVLRMHGDSITTGMYVSKGKSFYTADILVLNDGGAPVSGASVTANWAGKGVDTAASTKTTNSSGIAAFVTNGIKKPGELYTITIDDVVKSGYLYDEIGSATSGQYPPAAQNPPVAHDDNYSADEGAGLNVPAPGLLGNDTDAESDPLTAVLAGGPSHGSLNLNSDGSFSYTHDGSETTSDSFTYRANDGTVDSNTATVTITINPVNDAPTAVDDSASTQQDTPVVVDVLANDTDPEGDGLSISAVTQGTNGSVTNNGSDITYTPDPGFTGDDSFSYTADDGNGGTDTATVTVTVFSQNDPPTAVDDSASTDEDAAVVIDVLANDSDPDSDPLSVSAVTQGANGSVVNNGSDVTYTPDPDYHGPDSFTYTADDGNGGTDTATVSVTVLPVNDAPVAANDSASTPEDTAVVIDVLANDSDADGDTLTVLSTTQGANGTVVNNSGNVTYTPDDGYTGPDSFTYTADDGNGGTDTATVSVTVTASNSPLVADAGPDQSGTRREDLTFDGSNSNDPGGSITSWSWDFGDGKSGSGEIVEHDYKKAGTYTVTLTVTDDQGATDTDTATVTIN